MSCEKETIHTLIQAFTPRGEQTHLAHQDEGETGKTLCNQQIRSTDREPIDWTSGYLCKRCAKAAERLKRSRPGEG